MRDDHVPGQPRDAGGDPRPAVRDRRRRLRRRRRGGHGGDAAAARARHAAVRHVRPDAVRRRADGLRPAVPAQHAARVLEVAVPRRAHRRGDRHDRGQGAGPAGAADARQHVPHGRRDRRRRPGGRPRSPTRTAPYMVSIDGMWTERRPTTTPTSPGCASTWDERQASSGPASVYLNFTGLADEDAERRRRHRVRAQPRAARRRSRRSTTRTTSSGSTTTWRPA